MIEIQDLPPGSKLARLHPGDAPGPSELWRGTWVFAPSLTEPGGVFVLALRANMSRKDWRDFLRIVIANGWTTILAKRRDDQPIPFGVAGEDGITRSSVEQLAKRFLL